MLSDDDKRWITALIAAIEERIVATEERIREEILARTERVETRLLTEFQKWPSPLERTVRLSRERIHAIEEGIDELRDRITRLEGRGTPTETGMKRGEILASRPGLV